MNISYSLRVDIICVVVVVVSVVIMVAIVVVNATTISMLMGTIVSIVTRYCPLRSHCVIVT